MILSSYPFWWLALPVLLLPIWWHRQKRQRIKAELLATARFLPSAPPQQLRVWQWRDKLLLLVRCLMLVALIAWLAATIFPWRGDIVLIDPGADKAWAEQQIAAAGFSAASRIDLPPDAMPWLRQNERDWRSSAKLLIVARAEQIPMPARMPQLNHQLELRTQPLRSAASNAAAATRAEYHVAMVTEQTRAAAWESLFTAFSSAGENVRHYTLTSEPDAKTALIVWDKPDSTPPADWHSPHWWIPASASQPAAFPELAKVAALTINGITLKYIDTPRGRLWTSDAFPPRDADTARTLYETWQLLTAAPAPAYATPSQTFPAARSALPAISNATPAAWLAFALLALFMIERILTHARRF